ncbi:hypothetical protein DL98DRAFT_513213 [Cadophora sp. DSE1049]|nr:hypothetical protein DL98DRAFT_513213 [Cadophora sp. DSE1049]
MAANEKGRESEQRASSTDSTEVQSTVLANTNGFFRSMCWKPNGAELDWTTRLEYTRYDRIRRAATRSANACYRICELLINCIVTLCTLPLAWETALNKKISYERMPRLGGKENLLQFNTAP